MNNLPYQLSEGLFLERSQILVPWFKSLHQITKLGGAPFPANSKRTGISWRNELVFDGIKASVTALPMDGGVFLLSFENQPKRSTVREEYDFLLKAFVEKLGVPIEKGRRDYGYPFASWKWGDVQIYFTIRERFVDFVSLSISKGST